MYGQILHKRVNNTTTIHSKKRYTLLDGKKFAKEVEAQVITAVEGLINKGERPPGLAVILVGDNPASQAYVSKKDKVAKRCKFHTKQITLSADSTEAQLKATIDGLNNDPDIDGILLQLPLPKHLDSNKIIDFISDKKDADGLTSINQGLLIKSEGGVKPCTPLGSMYVLERYIEDQMNEKIAGKTAVVIGRSVLVGKPIALMLLEKNATVTIAHSKTKDLPELVSKADIVIAACGVPKLIKKSWIKKGAIVIDVGINRLEDGSLCGDVDFDDVAEITAAITPVPGGIGPMTVAMLIKNTLQLRLCN